MIKRRFYLVMSLIIAAIVMSGFGPHIDARLLHPAAPRPVILYIHAAVFTGWIVLFVLQTALISGRKIATHRRLGLCGAVLGSSIPFLGVATAIVVDRVDPHPTDGDAAFLILSIHDMLAFAITFGLALYWRKKPDYHRRLMFIGTCMLTSAAFARLIPPDAPEFLIYVGVDALILTALGRDWLMARRLPVVYAWSLPALVAVQVGAFSLYLARPAAWLVVAHRLIG